MSTQRDEHPANDKPSGRPVKPVSPSAGAALDKKLRAPVPNRDICAGLTGEYAVEARAAEESLRRRGADRELIHDLAEDGFAGPRYEEFANAVARYGISVMRGWLYSGHVFKLTAGRGYSLHPSPDELDMLAGDSDLREELATMTVAAALPQFHERALVQSGWSYDGGASLTTYFMGACVYAFPNELRRHRVQQARWRRQDGRDAHTYDVDRGAVNDTAALATGRLRVLDDLKRLSKREQAIVAATLDGYTQEEMVEMFDETSIRAIEGVLYRWRCQEQRTLKQEGEQR